VGDLIRIFNLYKSQIIYMKIRCQPQLAKQEKELPKSGDWLYELKYDGYRIISYIENGKAKLLSRNANDYTQKFHEISGALIKWANGKSLTVDGEIVIIDKNGKTDFQALQSFIKNPVGKNLTYIIFDLLAYGGKDIRSLPITERKKKLKQIMKTAPENLHYSEHFQSLTEAHFKSVCQDGFEGIIAKKANSVYSGTRNGDWIKLKCGQTAEFIIGGYTLSDKKSKSFSSVLLGYFKEDQLIYAGRAGTGFTENSAMELFERFEKVKQKHPPFKKQPAASKNERIIWLKPELSAEIKFAETTKSGLLRQASFKGLIKKEIIISNPQKLLFENPKITKAALAGYYQKISPRMLPYIKNRILSLVCCPRGVSKDCFFKKHLVAGNNGIKKANVADSDYFYINDISGILSLVQLSTIEFHTWGSTYDNIDKPDIMVFDLDPDEGMALDKIRQGVLDLKSILDKLKLKSYLKVSGGKGYHVVVPFNQTADWGSFRAFSKKIAEFMEQKWPDKYTSNVRKIKREGKIFIDWIRNTRGATSIAPYSVRARSGARVSAPIAWNELYKIAPDGITMEEAIERLNLSDPWKNFFKKNLKKP